MANDLVPAQSASSAAGVLMIVSGATTALASIGFIVAWSWFLVGLLWVVPLVVGLGEVLVGVSILGARPKARVRNVSAAGLVSALVSANLLGVVLEVIAQVLLSRAVDAGRRLESRGS